MEKKKIAVLTWFSNTSNFGSVLQAYAFQEILKKEGFNPTFINYRSKLTDLEIGSLIYNILLKILYKVKRIINDKEKRNNKEKINKEKCTEFVKANINCTKELKGKKELIPLNNEFDIFICGSDQIWSVNKKYNPCNYLNWVNSDKIKISYGSSISLNRITLKTKRFLKRYLNGFRSISVREKSSAEIVSKIISRPVLDVLDPTLLVGKSFWDDFIGDDNDVLEREKYILCYFLGNRDFYEYYIKKAIDETNYKIIFINTENLSKHFKEKYSIDYSVSPQKFIKLIRNAELIFSDSYHCMIFSYIFHKKFYVFERFKFDDRKSQNARIYDLADKLNLNYRIIGIENQTIDYSEIDFSKADQKYQELRNLSINYLQSFLL